MRKNLVFSALLLVAIGFSGCGKSSTKPKAPDAQEVKKECKASLSAEQTELMTLANSPSPAGGDTARIRAIVTSGTSLDFRNSICECALAVAANAGNFEFIRVALDLGANPNMPSNEGMTALHVASMRANLPIVNLLIEKRANASARNDHNQTPLHVLGKTCVTNCNRTDIIQSLIGAGADVNALDEFLRTPLHESAFLVADDAVNVILSNGGNVQNLDQSHRSVLHFLAMGIKAGTGPAAQRIIDRIATTDLNPLLEDFESKTALQRLSERWDIAYPVRTRNAEAFSLLNSIEMAIMKFGIDFQQVEPLCNRNTDILDHADRANGARRTNSHAVANGFAVMVWQSGCGYLLTSTTVRTDQ